MSDNTGAPQGPVLSPFLFTLYSTDFNYLMVANFVTQSASKQLQLSVTKTKEPVVDLRKTKAQLTPYQQPREEEQVLGCTWTTNWTWTLCTGSARVNSIFWDDRGPLTSAGRCWGCSMSASQCHHVCCCPKWRLSLTLPITLSTTCWPVTGACSATESYSHDAPLRDAENHSCMSQLNLNCNSNTNIAHG